MEEMPWVFPDMHGTKMQVGDYVWSRGNMTDESENVAYAGQIVGVVCGSVTGDSPEELDQIETAGCMIWVERDDFVYTKEAGYEYEYGGLMPTPERYLEPHELELHKQVWQVHSTLCHKIDMGEVVGKDRNDEYVRLGDRVIYQKPDVDEEPLHGRVITKAGTNVVCIAQDNQKPGKGIDRSRLSRLEFIATTDSAQAAENDEIKRKFEKLFEGSSLADRVSRLDGKLITYLHALIDEGVDAICDIYEQEHDGLEYADDQRDAIRTTLKTMIPFHEPQELWVIISVVHSILLHGSLMKLRDDLADRGMMNKDEAMRMLGDLMNATADDIDPKNKEQMSRRIETSKKGQELLGGHDPADDIVARYAANQN